MKACTHVVTGCSAERGSKMGVTKQLIHSGRERLWVFALCEDAGHPVADELAKSRRIRHHHSFATCHRFRGDKAETLPARWEDTDSRLLILFQELFWLEKSCELDLRPGLFLDQ